MYVFIDDNEDNGIVIYSSAKRAVINISNQIENINLASHIDGTYRENISINDACKALRQGKRVYYKVDLISEGKCFTTQGSIRKEMVL